MELTGSGDDDVGMTMVLLMAPVLVERQAAGAAAPHWLWVTDDQLHGRTCIRCGCGGGDLVPDGHVHSPTAPGFAPLGWAVAAHPICRERGR